VASRRDFFRALAKPAEKVKAKEKAPIHVRPPYALNESLFQSKCPQCESKGCAASCDEEIIVIGVDGIPILSFAKSGCTFCEECAVECVAGVLDLEKGAERINARFIISVESCMAHHGTICFSCKEPCLEDAILFAGLFNPVIDDVKCTGCGLCLGRCPTGAISSRPLPLAVPAEA
jgi:ferredoxin-type protein NapF